MIKLKKIIEDYLATLLGIIMIFLMIIPILYIFKFFAFIYNNMI